MSDYRDNPPAFPFLLPDGGGESGMTLRDWFAGQALGNPAICDGQASEWEMSVWFGKIRTGITRPEIIARQATNFADALLAARTNTNEG